MKIPFVDLKREANTCIDELITSTKEVLTSGIYINGPKVKEFEARIADYLNVKHVISLGNGSDGLTFIMKSFNLKNSDEVICPANSFIASSWSIEAAGLKPVFCDVGDDLLIDINDLKRKINKNTKVVMAVHLTGRICDMQNLKKICEENGIYLIEDSAQAFGASDQNNQKAGSFSSAASFSMHPLKNFAVYGDGGFVSTNDSNLAENIRLLRNHGLKNRDESIIWGYNSRLDELQASYALVKLKYIDNWTIKYSNIAKKYTEGLSDVIKKPYFRENYIDVYHNYVILVKKECRDLIMARLLEMGIDTKIHYPIPLHLQKCASNLMYREGDIKNAELLAKQMISLPIYPGLQDNELDYIIQKVNKVVKELYGI